MTSQLALRQVLPDDDQATGCLPSELVRGGVAILQQPAARTLTSGRVLPVSVRTAKGNGASGDWIASRAVRIKLLLRETLEVELECEFNYSPAVLVDDLSKVILCGLIVIKAASWIANVVNRSTSSIRDIVLVHLADGVERQIDVTRTQTTGRTNLRRIGLVEDIEEPGAELELLRLAEIEVLEERDVEVASAWRSQIERWL